MNAELEEKIESAIIKCADQAKAQQDSQKSLHYSQAALNLAHTKSVLDGAELNRELNRDAVKKTAEGGKKV